MAAILQSAVYYGDGSLVIFPCPFPSGAQVVLVNGVSASFTQGAGIVTMNAAPGAGASVTVVPKIADAGNQASTGVASNASAPAAVNLKALKGSILGMHLYNAAAYVVTIKFYDKVAPVIGTDVPKFKITIGAGASFSPGLAAYPINFDTAITYAITKLVADTDTTAVAAGDLTGWINSF